MVQIVENIKEKPLRLIRSKEEFSRSSPTLKAKISIYFKVGILLAFLDGINPGFSLVIWRNLL
jgi:hypothetical protein